jgi:hypothetical protein
VARPIGLIYFRSTGLDHACRRRSRDLVDRFSAAQSEHVGCLAKVMRIGSMVKLYYYLTLLATTTSSHGRA